MDVMEKGSWAGSRTFICRFLFLLWRTWDRSGQRERYEELSLTHFFSFFFGPGQGRIDMECIFFKVVDCMTFIPSPFLPSFSLRMFCLRGWIGKVV